MSERTQLICTWAGPVGLAIGAVGAGPFAHFLPSLLPSATPQEVAAIYTGNATGICIGSLLIMLGLTLSAVFFGEISVLIAQMEDKYTPLAFAQLITAVLAVVPLMLAPILWSAAALRSERSPDEIQLISDLGWLFYVIPVIPASVQSIIISLAIFGDKNPQRILPLWIGYLSVLVAFLFLPSTAAAIYKTGPLAWNGILGSVLPALSFLVWAIIMAIFMTRAILRQGLQT